MVRKGIHRYVLAVVLLAAASMGRAATIVGGVEDWGTSGIERNGDFNDMIFEITGSVNIDAPGGVFNNLTAAMVNQNGTVFWDNPSGDGPDMNIGYLLLGDSAFRGLRYLAAPNGGSANNVTFDATGTVTVTLTVVGGITGNPGNTLGWYALNDPSALHLLTAVPPSSVGETASFTPGGAFALYSTDGWGQVYSSVSANNVDAIPSQQHFAFFIEPQCSTVPEASTGVLMGLGVALLGLGAIPRRMR